MGAHLAALLGSEYASGLGTAALFAEDVTDAPLFPIDGEILVKRIHPIEDCLIKVRALPERAKWWMNRLEHCLQSV